MIGQLDPHHRGSVCHRAATLLHLSLDAVNFLNVGQYFAG